MTAISRTSAVALAEGTELLGEYQSPGVRETQQLVRRRDGQLLQLPPLLYAVAASLGTGSDLDRVAADASALSGRDLTAENVAYLIDAKLRPAGLVASGEDASPGTRATPLLGLRLRFGLVPERAHRAVSTALRPLFHPAVVISALCGLVAVDAWLLVHRVDVVAAGRQLLYRPQLLLLISALTIASAVFHETGHATAARRGGATPGVMGAGIYLIWPVFYTDVTDSYRLDRRGRLRTDLGGVYFNVLFALAAAGVYLATEYSPLLVFLVIAQLETLQQFLPFVRLDGYYVVSDLIGVPNLFVYMGPVLVLLTRRGSPEVRRAAQAKLANLKPWARRVVRAWVFLTAPILLVNLAVFLIVAPAVAGVTWASARLQAHDLAAAYGAGHLAAAGNDLVALALLATPLVGMLYVVGLCATRIARAARQWHRSRPVLAPLVLLGVAAALLVQVGGVWPRTFQSALRHAQIEQPAASARSSPPSPPPPIAVASGPVPTIKRPVRSPPLPRTATTPPPTTHPAPQAAAAACDAQSPGGAATGHPGRPTWLEELLCVAREE